MYVFVSMCVCVCVFLICVFMHVLKKAYSTVFIQIYEAMSMCMQVVVASQPW